MGGGGSLKEGGRLLEELPQGFIPIFHGYLIGRNFVGRK